MSNSKDEDPFLQVKHWFQRELFSGRKRSKFSPTERRVLDFAMFASWGKPDPERKKQGKKRFLGREHFECSGPVLVENIKGESELGVDEATRVLGGLVKRGIFQCVRPAKGEHPGVYAIETDIEKWLPPTGKTPRADWENTPRTRGNLPGAAGKTPSARWENSQDSLGKSPECAGQKPRVRGVKAPSARGKSPADASAIPQKDLDCASLRKVEYIELLEGAEREKTCGQDVAEFVAGNPELFTTDPPPDYLPSATLKILQQVLPGWLPTSDERKQIASILETDCADNLKIQAFEAATEDGRDYLDWARANHKPRTAAARHMLKAASAHLGDLLVGPQDKKPKPSRPGEWTPPYMLHCFNPDAKPPKRKEP